MLHHFPARVVAAALMAVAKPVVVSSRARERGSETHVRPSFHPDSRHEVVGVAENVFVVEMDSQLEAAMVQGSVFVGAASHEIRLLRTKNKKTGSRQT